MSQKNMPIGSLYFPSGFTVDQCKQEARQLKQDYKAKGEFLSYGSALNFIALEHANMPWDSAIQMVQEKQGQIKYHIARQKNPTQDLSPEDEFAIYRQVAENYFLKDGKLIIPESMDREVEMFQHGGEGLLITHAVEAKLDAVINQHGGIHALTESLIDFKIIFKNDENPEIDTHEFYFISSGKLIFYVRKTHASKGDRPNFFATHYMICYPGESPRPIQSASHYAAFLEEWRDAEGIIEATESYDA